MSLINEALKKAQKQRTGESPGLSSMPSIGGEKASQIARRGAPTGFSTLLLRLGLGLGVLVVLIVAGVFLFRGKGGETPPATTVATAPVAAPQPVDAAPVVVTPPPTPAPVVVATPAAPAPSTFVIPNATPPAVAPAKAEPPAPAPQPVVVQTVVAPPVVEAPKPEPARPAVPGKLEPRAINYIEAIRVTGIRASATDSKVLMNDRVYRLGDTVEHEMGLRLVGITSSSLTFEDERGAKYTRSF